MLRILAFGVATLTATIVGLALKFAFLVSAAYVAIKLYHHAG